VVNIIGTSLWVDSLLPAARGEKGREEGKGKGEGGKEGRRKGKEEGRRKRGDEEEREGQVRTLDPAWPVVHYNS
jgi:hypothetical protein